MKDFAKLPKIGNFIEIHKEMGKNTSISLGDHFENFVSASLSSGRYNNASEVVRAALRLLEDQEKKTIALNEALREGEESGFVKNFNPELLLEKLHKKHGIR